MWVESVATRERSVDVELCSRKSFLFFLTQCVGESLEMFWTAIGIDVVCVRAGT